MTDETFAPVPFDPLAEEAVIGSVLINPGIFGSIDLMPDQFFIYRNQWVWQAFIELQQRSVAIDQITVTDVLNNKGQLQEFGGPARLVTLLNRTPSSLHAEYYAEIVRSHHRRRLILETSQRLAKAAHDREADLDAVIGQTVDSLTHVGNGRYQAVHISEALSEASAYIYDRIANPSDTFGIPTGLIDLDRLTGGVFGLWYLAGAPGIGKSILMMQILVHAAREGYPVVLFSLEMSQLSQMLRVISAQAQFPTYNLRTGQASEFDIDRINAAIQELTKLPFYISDASGLTTVQFRADLARLKSKYGILLYGLDYMYLMGDAEQLLPTERTEFLSKRVKNITRDLGLNGIAIESVTKEGMNGKVAKSSDMRGSGQLAHDADAVLFVKQHEDLPQIRIVSVTKGREIPDAGGSGECELLKLSSYPLFQNLMAREFDPSKVR